MIKGALLHIDLWHRGKDFAFIVGIVVEYSLLNLQMHKIVILHPPLGIFRPENACSAQFMLFNCAPISSERKEISRGLRGETTDAVNSV